MSSLGLAEHQFRPANSALSIVSARWAKTFVCLQAEASRYRRPPAEKAVLSSDGWFWLEPQYRASAAVHPGSGPRMRCLRSRFFYRGAAAQAISRSRSQARAEGGRPLAA